jgi:hypothetical protein
MKLPIELAIELDLLAQAECKLRTMCIIGVLWRDLRRNKQRQALKLSGGAWNSNLHRKLAQGGALYVETIRSESNERLRMPSSETELPDGRTRLSRFGCRKKGHTH